MSGYARVVGVMTTGVQGGGNKAILGRLNNAGKDCMQTEEIW